MIVVLQFRMEGPDLVREWVIRKLLEIVTPLDANAVVQQWRSGPWQGGEDSKQGQPQ